MTEDQSNDGKPIPKSNKISRDTVATWETFLVKCAPNKRTLITNLAEDVGYEAGRSLGKLRTPTIELPCDSEACGGMKFFDCITETYHTNRGKWGEQFLTYRCRHCRRTIKEFAVSFFVPEDSTGAGVAIKYGEIPAFGPRVPPRVLELIHPNEAFFKQGLRAESQGLGIGAFTYYRRVVENQKDHLFEAIISAAQETGIPSDTIEKLRKAKASFRFRQSVDDFKHLIPESLLITSHNPLKLLHSALSAGLHNDSDEECLRLARDIRVILTELAEKLAQAIKHDDEINRAVERLTSRGDAKKPRGSAA